MSKKYEILFLNGKTGGSFKTRHGAFLHRIKALVDIPMHDVKAGDLGGWIEKEENLSQADYCWVGGDAMVYGNARIQHNSIVTGNAEVCENAVVSGDSRVSDEAKVIGSSSIISSRVCEHSFVGGKSCIYEHSRIGGAARILDSTVGVFSSVYDCAQVVNSRVEYYCDIYEDALVERAGIYKDSKVHGKAVVFKHAEITSAEVQSTNDYQTFLNTWSSGRHFTYTRSNKMWVAGCFYGTGEELIKKAYEDSELSGRCYEMYVNLAKQLEEVKSNYF